MNKKNIWLVIPTMFMPYLVVVILSIMMFGENNPFGKINPLGIILLYTPTPSMLNKPSFARLVTLKFFECEILSNVLAPKSPNLSASGALPIPKLSSTIKKIRLNFI
jgi:hypothetical protein